MKTTALPGKIAATLIGAILALACAEFFLRGVAAYAEHRQAARNLQAAQARGSYKILCIGESTTMNQYPPLLEQTLNKHGVGIKFTVIDKGLASTTTGAILGKLEEYLDTYSPDMVVAMMGINDQLPPDAYGKPGFLSRLRIFGLFGWLRRLQLLPLFAVSGNLAWAADSNHALFHGCEIERFIDYPCIDNLKNTGKIEDAVAICKRLSEKNGPGGEFGCIKLIHLQAERGDFASAQKTLRSCLGRMPSRALYHQAGILATNRHDYPEAIRLLEKALAAKSFCCEKRELSDTHYALAKIYQYTSNPKKQEEHLKKIAELDPSNFAAVYHIVDFYDKNGRKQEAVAELKKRLPEVSPAEKPTYLTALAQLTNDNAMARNARELENRYNPITAANYRAMVDMTLKRGLKFVAVQYPIRPVEQVKDMLNRDPRVVYVDNEESFKKSVQKEGYESYFIDRFGGDFGHCTMHGNLLLAENIANAILDSAFKIPMHQPTN